MDITRFFYTLGTVVLSFFILVIGKNILIPFVLAVFIWYLINTLASVIQQIPVGKSHFPTWLSYFLAISFIIVILGLLANLISINVAQIGEAAPRYQERLISVFNDALTKWPSLASTYSGNGLEALKQMMSQINFKGILTNIAFSLKGLISSGGLIGIYIMFLFLEQKSFKVKLEKILSNKTQNNKAFSLIEQIGSDIRKYIGIKTMTSAATGIIGYILMSSVDLDFAAFWAILLFLFNYIPTVGSIIATIFPSLLALVQFTGIGHFAGIALGLISIQVAIGSILEPRLMGSSLNLSPLAIILSLVLWGAVWQIPGMILCVPITVICMIIFSHFKKTQPLAILLSKDGKITRT